MNILADMLSSVTGLLSRAALFVASFDSVTFAYCLLILFVATWLSYLYLIPLQVLSQRLARLTRQGSWGDLEEEEDLRRHSVAGSLLEGIWPAARPVVRDFLKSWEEKSFLHDGTKVSRVDAQDWFALERMAGPAWESPVARSTPFLFTGMGILGTFSGIVMSLGHLRVDAGNLDSAITPLLGGMRTAFAASFLGVLFAVLWTVIAGGLRGRIVHRHRWLLERILRAYPTWDPAESLALLARDRASPAAALDELPVRLGQALDDGLGSIARGVIVPALERMERLLEQTATRDGVIQAEQLRRLGDHFVEALSRATGGHLLRLGQNLQDASAFQNESASTNRKVIEQLGRLTEKMETVITQAAEAASRIEQIGTALQGQGEGASRQLQGLARLDEKIGERALEQERAARDVMKRQESLLADMRLQVEGFERASQAMNRNLQDFTAGLRAGTESMDAAARSLAGRVESTMERTGAAIDGTVTRLEKGVVGGLNEAMGQIDTGLARAIEAFSQTLKRTELTVEQLPRVIHELSRTLEAARRPGGGIDADRGRETPA